MNERSKVLYIYKIIEETLELNFDDDSLVYAYLLIKYLQSI
jgi:hypothetical protein